MLNKQSRTGDKGWSSSLGLCVGLTTHYKNELVTKCFKDGGERCLHGFGCRPEGKRSWGRPRHRWEDNIKLDLRWGEEDRVQWRAFVNTLMNLLVP